MGELGKVSYQRKGEAFVQYGMITDVGILDKRSGKVFKNTVSWINYLDFKRIQNSRELPWSVIHTNKLVDNTNYSIIITPESDYELLYSSDIY